MENIKKGASVTLWDGACGKIEDICAKKANIILDSGKRVWADIEQIIDVKSDKKEDDKLAKAKERLSHYKSKIKNNSKIEKLAPGKVDEKKWDEAKDTVKKQKNKNFDDFSDKDWGLVNHIYQNMGGTFEKKAIFSDALDYFAQIFTGEKVEDTNKISQALQWVRDAYDDSVLDKVSGLIEEYITKPSKDLADKILAKLEEEFTAYSAKYANKVIPLIPKTAGHLKEIQTKYCVGDILVDDKNALEHKYLHIIDATDDEYTIRERPLTSEHDDTKQGVNYKMPVKKIDSDKTLRKFASANTIKEYDIRDIEVVGNVVNLKLNDFDAVFDKKGNFIKTSGNSSMPEPYKKEFGNMIKTCGVEVLARAVTQKRLAQKIASLSPKVKVEVTASLNRLQKKAARLGNYDFDVHGQKNWVLEKEGSEQKIKRIKN